MAVSQALKTLVKLVQVEGLTQSEKVLGTPVAV